MSYSIGSHLVTWRIGYTHHGIYVGNDTVVHYLNEEGITTASLKEFSLGNLIWVRRHRNARYSGEECAERAWSRVGEDNYNLVFNNCEHFATWCVTGEASSEQVNEYAKLTLKKVSDTINPTRTIKPYGGEERKGDIIPTTSIWFEKSVLDKHLSGRDRDDEGDFWDRADKATTVFFEKAGDVGVDAVNKVADVVDAVKDFFRR